jgi:hypothetical protein
MWGCGEGDKVALTLEDIEKENSCKFVGSVGKDYRVQLG